ncbi:MAG: hypothetical protein ACK5Y6_01660 [Pseudomonadota bacterium]
MLQKIGLFICVFFFSGSMVLMGARDMRDRLSPPQEPEVERAKKLIQALRGDELFKIEAKYDAEHEKPARKPGSYLPEYDLRKLKTFLGSLIGADAPPGQQQEQPKPAE